MTEAESQRIEPDLRLAAQAGEFVPADARAISREIERRADRASFDRVELVLARLNRAHLASTIDGDQFAEFQSRLKVVALVELGPEQLPEGLAELPTLEDVTTMLQTLHAQHRADLDGSHPATALIGLDQWHRYRVGPHGLTGRITMYQDAGLRHLVAGNELIPSVKNLDDEDVPVFDCEAADRWLGNDFGRVRIDVGTRQRKKPAFPVFEDRLIEQVGGQWIITCHQLDRAFSPSVWDGIVDVSHEEGQPLRKRVAVIGGQIIREVAGLSTEGVHHVHAEVDGTFSGIIAAEIPGGGRNYHFILGGERVPSPSGGDLLCEFQQEVIFHDNTFSGTMRWHDGHFARTGVYIAGEYRREIDGQRVFQLDCPHVLDGTMNGLVKVMGQGSRPLIEGHIIERFEGKPIIQCFQTRNYGGKLNGILVLEGGEWIAVTDGQRVTEVSGEPIEVNSRSEIFNIGGTSNGVFQRKRRLDQGTQPVVLGKWAEEWV